MAADREAIRIALESGAVDDCFAHERFGSEALLGLGFDAFVRLVDSIATSGYDPDCPVLVNQWGEVVEGHHRTAACQLLGVEPVRRAVTRRHRHYCVLPCSCGEADRETGTKTGTSTRKPAS
jgi:hypothetical protein